VTGSASGVFVATEGGGVFRTTDNGATWTRANGGLVKSWVLSLSFSTGGASWQAGTFGGGFFVSEDSGRTWTPRSAGLELGYAYPTVLQYATRGSVWYVGMENDGVYRSTDLGATWSPASTGLPQLAPVTGLAVRGTDLIATTAWSDGVYRSTDDGGSWTQIMSGFRTLGPSALAIGGTGTIFAGATEGSVLRSTNTGATWLGAPLGGSAAPRTLRFVGNTMFAGTDGAAGLYRSTNFGVSWAPAGTGLEGRTVSFIATLDTTVMFVSTADSGVFVSTNNGASWRPSNAGLPTLKLDDIRSTGPYLYVATREHGVWRRRVSEVLTSAPEGETEILPKGFALWQNYPNPFNPSTVVRFAVPSTGEVSVTVYNLVGEAVATLVSGVKEAGIHETVWDASGVPSGVYLCRLSAGGHSETRKLMLIR
jgi:photosystem II stability/assembly factor-like uncharacterized protein